MAVKDPETHTPSQSIVVGRDVKKLAAVKILALAAVTFSSDLWAAPANVLYQIPFASDSIRLIVGGVCLVFVLAIFGSWLPRALRSLRGLPYQGRWQSMAIRALALIPIAIGAVPLAILLAIIRNPMAYVSDVGVVKESLYAETPLSFTWQEIAHVSCKSGSGSGPRWFTFRSSDGRKIAFSNPGGMDFRSLRGFLEERLGPAVMQGCPTAVR